MDIDATVLKTYLDAKFEELKTQLTSNASIADNLQVRLVFNESEPQEQSNG